MKKLDWYMSSFNLLLYSATGRESRVRQNELQFGFEFPINKFNQSMGGDNLFIMSKVMVTKPGLSLHYYEGRFAVTYFSDFS